ncbi:hypothetical protein BX600DRAFT_23640 [Xylariales sp. PMI_506]|nr:hypothetical protein BX600DRAFT_23640 [Xylariales sp. PMI_506]
MKDKDDLFCSVRTNRMVMVLTMHCCMTVLTTKPPLSKLSRVNDVSSTFFLYFFFISTYPCTDAYISKTGELCEAGGRASASGFKAPSRSANGRIGSPQWSPSTSIGTSEPFGTSALTPLHESPNSAPAVMFTNKVCSRDGHLPLKMVNPTERKYDMASWGITVQLDHRQSSTGCGDP